MEVAIDRFHLSLTVVTQECSIPKDVRSRLQPAIDRIGWAVENFPDSQLLLTVVYHPRSNVHHAEAKLKVPGETIVAGAAEEHIDSAILRCLVKVARRAEIYQADPDQDAVDQAVREARLRGAGIGPVDPEEGSAGRAIQVGDYSAFRHAMLLEEEPLRKRVGRWIQRYPRMQQQIGRNFEIADLVEEVFLLAFERYPDRPTHLSMHEWLDNLIDPAVKAFWYDPDDRQAVSYAQTLGTELSTSERPRSR